MIGTILRNETGEIALPVSPYQPDKSVKDLTVRIGQDFSIASNLQNKPFEEFNDCSLLQREDLDRKRWNAYREPKSADIDEAWRWNGIRPITRNKIIGIVAQMTSKIVVPAPYAQNDKDEIDVSSAQIMRDLMEYDIRNSSYVDNYIMWITDALVSPVAYLGTGFFESMQTIKEENEGKISKKEVLDGVFSGFQTFNIPIDEVLIGNYYQKTPDRQRFVIRRRFIDYDEARSMYGKHENFKYVRPGIKIAFNTENRLFYDAFDPTLETLCEEVVYKNRLEDSEIVYCNGIYLGDSDTEANMIKHRDNENKPKYNFATLGYEDISSRFFFYKSAAWKLGDDDALVIRTEQLLADATFLETMTPTITRGQGQMSEAIMIPGKNTAFDNPNVTVEPIRVGGALSSAFNLLLKKEKDMSESSQDPMATGVQTAPKTAEEARLLAQNAKIALGRFGNMLASSLKKVGGLMIDVILQHQTVGDIEETSDGETVQKFKTFILTDSGDDKLTKKISFDTELPEMTEEESMAKSEELLKQEGGIDSKTRLAVVNPVKWRKLKFLISVDVEELLPLSLRQSTLESMALQNQQLNPQKVANTTQQ